MDRQGGRRPIESAGEAVTTDALVDAAPVSAPPAALRMRSARLAYGSRVLWDGLDLDVRPGEFLAVLGPNGSGKTSMLRVLLGQQPLSAGTVTIAGSAAGKANDKLGYIPQQRAIDANLTLRARDLVGLGLDGHRWGLGLRGRAERRRRWTPPWPRSGPATTPTPGRPALRRRTAAAADGAGAGRRPRVAAVRRAAAVAGPRPPARGQRSRSTPAAGPPAPRCCS